MKKPTSDKRVDRPRRYEVTSRFEKDWDRLSKAGRFDMRRLKAVMLLLIANDGPLPIEWRDHALTGEWKDFRDCHVHGDFLLIYRIYGDSVVFARAGTHADLFK